MGKQLFCFMRHTSSCNMCIIWPSFIIYLSLTLHTSQHLSLHEIPRTFKTTYPNEANPVCVDEDLCKHITSVVHCWPLATLTYFVQYFLHNTNQKSSTLQFITWFQFSFRMFTLSQNKHSFESEVFECCWKRFYFLIFLSHVFSFTLKLLCDFSSFYLKMCAVVIGYQGFPLSRHLWIYNFFCKVPLVPDAKMQHKATLFFWRSENSYFPTFNMLMSRINT